MYSNCIILQQLTTWISLDDKESPLSFSGLQIKQTRHHKANLSFLLRFCQAIIFNSSSIRIIHHNVCTEVHSVLFVILQMCKGMWTVIWCFLLLDLGLHLLNQQLLWKTKYSGKPCNVTTKGTEPFVIRQISHARYYYIVGTFGWRHHVNKGIVRYIFMLLSFAQWILIMERTWYATINKMMVSWYMFAA